MSIFSTIAYDSTHETRRIPFKGIGSVIAALVLGAAIGFAIADNPPAADAPTAASTGIALDDFIRLNTTSYDGLVPAASAAVIESQSVGDANFLYWNTTAFDNLIPMESAAVSQAPNTVDPDFWHWNVASLEYPAGRYSEQPNGPR